jgi:hypothetical protein
VPPDEVGAPLPVVAGVVEPPLDGVGVPAPGAGPPEVGVPPVLGVGVGVVGVGVPVPCPVVVPDGGAVAGPGVPVCVPAPLPGVAGSVAPGSDWPALVCGERTIGSGIGPRVLSAALAADVVGCGRVLAGADGRGAGSSTAD